MGFAGPVLRAVAGNTRRADRCRCLGRGPTPIPRCDQQFNYLLERRERLFQELARLDDAERSSAVAKDVAARIEEFIDSMHYLDDGARLRLKSASTEGFVKSEL